MSEFEFSQAKNGSQTCSRNGIFLHSQYNPENEAANFVKTRNFDFEPQFIVTTAPALSYCAPFFRERFPAAKLIAIEYSHKFSNCARLFDDYFIADSASACAETMRKIFFKYGEKSIFFTAFFSWLPSEKAFPVEYQNCWRELKNLLKMSANLIATRNYFNRRWAKNAFKFFKTAKNFILPAEKCKKPILICASGLTLKKSLATIRARRDEFFLIALSSALEALFAANVNPDLIFSTDGGFYAKSHIASKKIVDLKIPLAISPESAVNSEILKNADILPLNYGDESCQLFEILKLQSQKASRNGTVSGTALEFALEFSDSKIFFCGLDLAAGKIGGFSHALPNANETQNSQWDFRLNPCSSRLFSAAAKADNSSFEIYSAWFENLPREKKSRVVRIKDENDEFLRHIEGIEEKNWQNLSRQKLEKNPSFFAFGADLRDKTNNFAQKLKKDFAEFCEKNSGNFAKNWLETLDFSFYLQWQKSKRALKLDESRKRDLKKILSKF